MYHTIIGPNDCLVSFSITDGVPTHADTINMLTGHVCMTKVFNQIKPTIRKRQARNFWKRLVSRGYTL